MREAHPVERAVGMEYYVSDADGVGGQLRTTPDDFRVREREQFATEPVDADEGAYPHLVVRATLRNWDTNDFAGTLSDRLGISRERVSWAGTKDKRAVTTQLFSIQGIEPDALPTVHDAEIEPIGRAGRPILFGDLAGNEFEITLRAADEPANAGAVTDDLQSFAGALADDDWSPDGDGSTTVAVPNYFGQQRFGSRRPVTHEVGLEIVRGSWERAVLAYVGNPHEREPDASRRAREYVAETRDWQGAIDRFPEALGYERSLCHYLADHGADSSDAFRAALETLPTNLQQLFVNAAQSYLFNRIVSKRLRRGLPFDRPVSGDVVCFHDADAPAGLAVPDPDRSQRVTEDRLTSVTRHCERNRAFVTAPLIGTDTELAEGAPGEIEREVLADVGIGPADFDLPGEFHSEGTRRAICVSTDLAIERVDGDATGANDGDDTITFTFFLPKGSYATVVLREYLKRDPENVG
ncbi:MAG: tRNA pseudouridine(13) synthase TruD [Haloarculaceae archaeon]